MSRRLLDFTPVWKGEVPLAEFVADLTPDDLRELTNDMVDVIRQEIVNAAEPLVIAQGANTS